MTTVFGCLIAFCFCNKIFATKSLTTNIATNTSFVITRSSGIPTEPAKCYYDGKQYNEGESWQSGYLRYKCKKFGAYSILGCRTKSNRELQIGETYIEDFIVHQCFKKGSTTYYHEAVCDLVGQPSCDSFRKTPPENQTFSSTGGLIDQTKGLPAVSGLPEGWKIVDAQGNTIPISRLSVISETTGSGSLASKKPKAVVKRQIVKGISSAIEVPIDDDMKRNQVVGVGTGSVSLDSRRPTISTETKKLRPGTTAGTRSDVNWKGKTMMINGKRIAVGPGTFTFGTSPTGNKFIH